MTQTFTTRFTAAILAAAIVAAAWVPTVTLRSDGVSANVAAAVA